jgi:hypothetical protein
MDFQLKTLTVAQAAAEKSDVLIVLVGSAPLTTKDPLSVLAASARKAGDLPDKAGKLLTLYRPDDVVASRVVLAAIGDGKPASVRSGVIAAAMRPRPMARSGRSWCSRRLQTAPRWLAPSLPRPMPAMSTPPPSRRPSRAASAS